VNLGEFFAELKGNKSCILRLGIANALNHWAHDGKRFVVRADAKLTAFVELESAIGRTNRKRE
jgi:hypothetical protein